MVCYKISIHMLEQGRDKIARAMLRRENDTSVLLSAVKDPYGNFVVQKVREFEQAGRSAFIITTPRLDISGS